MPTKNRDRTHKWKEKDSVLQIRLSEHEKEQFLAICRDLDTSAARELRLYIRDFIQKHNQGKLI